MRTYLEKFMEIVKSSNDKLYSYLNSLYKTEFVFIPTPGKTGDALLAHVSYTLFDKLGLKYTCGTYKDRFKGRQILVGGGGNLIGGVYFELREFIGNNFKDNQITILPHTIHDIPELGLWMQNANFKIFARDPITFEYASQHATYLENVILVEDIVLLSSIKQDEFLDCQKEKWAGICNAFRVDEETTGILPKDNFDVSGTWSGAFWHNKLLCMHVAHSVASYLSPFRTIRTNRLHIAILAAILGKDVELYSNLYYKNQTIYDYSLKERFPNIKMLDAYTFLQ
jgi:exopolysaccharide biosynthesis predicted pyruvyltransferase EpsI